MEVERRRRVAVIGAGASGLPAIKCCLDEGLLPVCFERTGHIGGLWHYTDKPIDGQACVMKSTVINSSKEMTAYSDFPVPSHFSNFMHNSQVMEYFRLYSSFFKLEEYINFHTEVLSVMKAGNYPESGEWLVRTRNVQTGDEKEETFDGVIVCTGHHAIKYMPQLSGIESFKGKVLHVHDLREINSYQGKKVLVVGMGNSGADAAVELSWRAGQILMSTRRGAWIMRRVAPGGMPADLQFATRPVKFLLETFPKLMSKMLERNINATLDHDAFCLRPPHEVFAIPPLVNDELPNRIVSGAIKIKDDISNFTEFGAEFKDGSKEDDLDAVILATGYSISFPFLNKEVIDTEENQVSLYKYMFPPDLPFNNLAIIGLLQPVGSTITMSEMQARLAAAVIKGNTKLPSPDEMWKDIRSKKAALARRYFRSRRLTIQVDYIPYMDELAALIGCTVDHASLIKKDPVLGFKVLFGPVLPCTYRLFGPGKWPGARDTILTVWDRVRAPLNTRPVSVSEQQGTKINLWLIFIVAVVVFLVARFLL